MKRIRIQIFIALFLFTIAANSQEAIKISGTRFTYPIVEKWISEYKKQNPETEFKLVRNSSEANQSDISIIAHQPTVLEVKEDKQVIFVNKYVLLPVTSISNKFLENIKKRGLNKKEIEKLFFQETILDEFYEGKTTKPLDDRINIYSRESQASSAIAFANHFGFQSMDIKGKKVSVDDIYLISSIQKDVTGITFNTLGYLFDLKTRKIKDGIALLPLDINEKAKISINSSIDEALTTIENDTFETIPVEKVGFIFNNNPQNKEVAAFVKWVVTDGQKYNHEFGFLNLDKKLQVSQSEELSEKYLTAK